MHPQVCDEACAYALVSEASRLSQLKHLAKEKQGELGPPPGRRESHPLLQL